MKKNPTKKLLRSAKIMTTQLVIYWIFSKQTNKLKDPQQISFIGKLVNQTHGAITFFTIEKSEETTFEFLQNSIKIL